VAWDGSKGSRALLLDCFESGHLLRTVCFRADKLKRVASSGLDGFLNLRGIVAAHDQSCHHRCIGLFEELLFACRRAATRGDHPTVRLTLEGWFAATKTVDIGKAHGRCTSTGRMRAAFDLEDAQPSSRHSLAGGRKPPAQRPSLAQPRRRANQKKGLALKSIARHKRTKKKPLL
jgi:hypothetical protein